MSNQKLKKQKYTAKFRRRAAKLLMAHLDTNVDIETPEIDNKETVDITSQYIVAHEYYTDVPAWGTTKNHRVSFTILNHPYTACKQLLKQFKGSANSGLINQLNDSLDFLRSDLVASLRTLYGLNVNEAAIDNYNITMPFAMGACLLDVYNTKPPAVSQYEDNMTVATAGWMGIIKGLPVISAQVSQEDDIRYNNINVAAREVNKLKRVIESKVKQIKLDEVRVKFEALRDLTDKDGDKVELTDEVLNGVTALYAQQVAISALDLLGAVAVAIINSQEQRVVSNKQVIASSAELYFNGACNTAVNNVMSAMVTHLNLPVEE